MNAYNPQNQNQWSQPQGYQQSAAPQQAPLPTLQVRGTLWPPNENYENKRGQFVTVEVGTAKNNRPFFVVKNASIRVLDVNGNPQQKMVAYPNLVFFSPYEAQLFAYVANNVQIDQKSGKKKTMGSVYFQNVSLEQKSSSAGKPYYVLSSGKGSRVLYPSQMQKDLAAAREQIMQIPISQMQTNQQQYNQPAVPQRYNQPAAQRQFSHPQQFNTQQQFTQQAPPQYGQSPVVQGNFDDGQEVGDDEIPF